MKLRSILKTAIGVGLAATSAQAYEYPLQFTPNPGYRGLVVAGYQISDGTVIGNCSYYTAHSGSGRGGGYHTYYTYYNQTCTWDLQGNLLAIAACAPTVPTPLHTSGTETVYAQDVSGDFAGSDTALLPDGGFVNTLGSHYTWLTSNAYQDLTQQVYTLQLQLKSDGETPLTISSVNASALAAKVKVTATTCSGQIAVGATCTVTVIYNPKKLRSPTGLAYDTLTVSVASDAGEAHNFIQSYTISVKKGGADGG